MNFDPLEKSAFEDIMKTFEKYPDTLGIKTVAKILGVSEQTARNYIDQGHITCLKLPSGYRKVFKKDLALFIAKSRK